MTAPWIVRWRHAGWSGWLDLAAGASPGACLALADAPAERRSRHAHTRPVATAAGRWWVKTYAAPAGRRARRAWRMAEALRACGFAAPAGVAVATAAGAGVLVMRDTDGDGLLETVAALRDRSAKRRLLRRLGTLVARLHEEGFVHGDLVASNVQVRDDDFVLLDHDRTRRAWVLVWWGARRNLVQLGRLVVPGVRTSDRLRVLRAYADARRLSRRARHRLARWVAAKTVARRCAIDGIPPGVARRAGFAAVMRSGGPFDPAHPLVKEGA